MVDYGVFTKNKSISAKRRSDTIDNTFTAAKQWVTLRQRNANVTTLSTIQ